MGYFTRGSNNWPDTKIQCFRPDNDDQNLYIDINYSSISIPELIEKIKEHFGEDSNLEKFEISAENIHTDCLGYDLYDPSDYTMYLHIWKAAL